jgi:DMSO reductase family type II enzyme heme b subunit
MNHLQQKLLEILCAAALIGCVRTVAAEPNQPAGDDLKFIAPFVDVANGAFEHPDVANGPWNALRPKKVILLPQNLTTPSRLEPVANDIDVRIVHNGVWIGIAVTWPDDERNHTTPTGGFSNALAIGFPKQDFTTASPFMGAHEGGMEINSWKAALRRNDDAGYQEVLQQSPNTVPDDDPTSQADRKTPRAQSFGEGYGTLTSQKQQDARANAMHQDGHWTVVITRPLDTGDDADVVLAAGKESAINFAVWNGEEGDVGGKKSYTMFTPLLIAGKE